MGDTLRGLGFTVVELRDAQKDQMTEAIAKVRDALKGNQGVSILDAPTVRKIVGSHRRGLPSTPNHPGPQAPLCDELAPG